ncbi:MAG: caspase family protein [Cytophagaceae bacterium]
MDLIVQNGHSAMINSVSFSSDGKYIASFGLDKVIKVWDLKSGKEFRSIVTAYTGMGNVYFSHDGKTICGFDSNDSIKIWSIEDGTVRHAISKSPLNYAAAITVHPADRILAFCGLGIAVKNYQTGATVWEIKENKLSGAIAFSKDGSMLAAAGIDGMVGIFDTKTGKALKQLKIPSFSPSSGITLSFSQDRIAVNSSDAVYIFEAGSGKIIFTHRADMIYSHGISADQKSIAVSQIKNSRPTLEIIDIASGNPVSSQPFAFGKISSSSQQPVFASAQSDIKGPSIRVCSFSSGKTIQYLRGSFYMMNKALFADNHYIVSAAFCGTLDRPLKIWDLRSGTMKGITPGKTTTLFDLCLSQDKSMMAVCGADSVTYLYNTGSFSLLAKWRNTETWTQTIAISPDKKNIATGSFNGKVKLFPVGGGQPRLLYSHSTLVNSVLFSGDGKYLYTGSIDSVNRWNMNSGKQEPSIFTPIGHPVVKLYPAAGKFFIGDHRVISVLKSTDYTPVREFNTPILPPNPILSLAYKPARTLLYAGYLNGDIVQWNESNGDSLKLLKAHSLSVKGLDVSDNSRHLVSGSHDSKLILWDADKGEQVATFISLDSSNYLIFTPDNYYKGTKDGMQAVAFRQGTKLFAFDQFDLQFNRPDIVLERLGYADTALIRSYKRAYQKRLKRMGFSPEMFNNDFHFPMAELTYPSESVYHQQDLSFGIKVWDDKYKLDRVNVYVNDVPVHGRNGISLTAKNTSEYSFTENLPLSNGKNRISVSVLNSKGVESLKESFEISYEAKNQKPDLYIYSIGTSNYKDERMNLKYAGKDAQDMVSLFQARTDLFGTIHQESLVNEKSTLENIAALKAKLLQTKPDDYVILFVAGHGLLDKNLDYYLATYDVDFNNPSHRGLAYEKLEDLLDGIPARNKTILIDACHSGEVDKEEVTLAIKEKTEEGEVSFRAFGNTVVTRVGLENSFELMKDLFTDLRKSTGTTIISSAGGAEYAMEGEQWKNGVFTYSLIKGLKNKEADLNQDGTIMLSELQNYLQKNVSELTGGKQKPTSRIQNLNNDFVIW